MQSEKVFIGLSEPIVQLDLKRIFTNMGFQNILCFSTCERLLEQTLSSPLPPDIIILETFFNRDSDGIETAELIRKKHNVPLLFLTSRSLDEVKNKNSLPECIYLSKPFEEEILVNSVKRLLRSKR